MCSLQQYLFILTFRFTARVTESRKLRCHQPKFQSSPVTFSIVNPDCLHNFYAKIEIKSGYILIRNFTPNIILLVLRAHCHLYQFIVSVYLSLNRLRDYYHLNEAKKRTNVIS